MLRLIEIVLLLAPLAAFVAWRVFMPGQMPSLGLIAGAAVLLLIMAGSLLWLRAEDAAPPDSIYIPQHMDNGRIVPGRSVTR